MRHAVHTITIQSVVGNTRDTRGRTTPRTSRSVVKGIASLVGAREVFKADQQGRTVSVAVQVPTDTEVDTKDNIVVSGTGALGLDGPYTIVELRPDRHTTRLLCERYELPVA